MKFLKQKVALLLAISMLMTGCNLQINNDDAVQPKTQKKVKSSDFKEENELFNSIPKNGLFFAFQNSDTISQKVEAVVSNIVETFSEAPGVDMTTKMLINSNKNMAIDYFKQIQYGAFLIQVKGERLKNGDIDLLLNEDIDEKEAMNYFAEEACVALATEINIKEYQYFIDQAKESMVPIVKYKKVGDVNIFSFGNCDQKDIDFLSNRDNLKNNSIVALSDNTAIDFDNIKNTFEEKAYLEAGNDPIMNYINDLIDDVSGAINQLNSIIIINSTNKSFYALKIEEDKIQSTKIMELDSNEKMDMLKNSLIGKSMQKPMSFTEDVDFSFKHKIEGNTIYYQENIENLNWSVLAGPIISPGSSVGPLVVITIVGILATGASTVYTSAQQKARDSIRQADLMMLKSAVEQYYGDNGEYPQQLNEAVENGYITMIPRDPKTGAEYVYEASDNGQEFSIGATLESSGKNDNLFKVGNSARKF